jgi:hypothetical protein
MITFAQRHSTMVENSWQGPVAIEQRAGGIASVSSTITATA